MKKNNKKSNKPCMKNTKCLAFLAIGLAGVLMLGVGLGGGFDKAEGPCAGSGDWYGCLSQNYPVGTQAVVLVDALEDLGVNCPESLAAGTVTCTPDIFGKSPMTAFDIDAGGRVAKYAM